MPARSATIMSFVLSFWACGGIPPTPSEPPADLNGFEFAGTLTTTRFFHTSTSLKDGRVLITGGFETDRPGHSSPEFSHATAELFDPERGNSTSTGSMSQGRTQDTAVLLQDGRVLIMGAQLYPAEIYDPKSERFSILADTPALRRGVTTTILSTGAILATDGGGNAGILNPETWRFTPTERMITPRSLHTATLLNDGRVLIAGGFNATGLIKRTEIYDPSSNAFTGAGELNDERWGHEALLLHDGRVLIIGGRTGTIDADDVQSVTTAEMFDPARGMFATSGDSGLASVDAAFLLPSGKVFLLLAGDVAIYDPSTGTVNRTGHSIGQNRLMYTVTPLKDGRIMFSGGLKDLVSTNEVLVYSP